jgi:hypothetical protein
VALELPQQQLARQAQHQQEEQPPPLQQHQQHQKQQHRPPLPPPLQQQQEQPPPPPPPPQQQQQQQQQEQQQGQPAEWCMLAPTAPLLTELLPLLTRQCLRNLQQQQQQQSEASSIPSEQPYDPWTLALPQCLLYLKCLLTLCSVGSSANEVAAAGPSQAAMPAAAAAAAVGHHTSCGSDRCALHAQDAIMPHACSILSIFEAALRCAAAEAGSANAPAPAAATAAATPSGVTGVDASYLVHNYAVMLVDLCQDKGSWDHTNRASPLVLLAVAAGPGSQVQRQLHSLLATMVKLSGWGILDGTGRQNVCNAAACAVSDLLIRAAEMQQEQGPVGTGSSSSSGGCAAAMAMLPSAVILGRCCLQLAVQMQAGIYAPPKQQGALSAAAATLSAVRFSLQTGITRDQLVAAGYAQVLQQLEQLASLQVVQASPSDSAAVLAAAKQLKSIGLALCSFAVPCMCNNPGCTSMAGLSELVAVSGRSCICAGCRVARYCGRACQRAAWKQHKPVCGALSAAAGGGAEAAGLETQGQ